MASQARGAKGPGNRPGSKGNRPGQNARTQGSRPGQQSSKAGGQTSAQRRQAASKAVSKARSGSSGNSRIWWTIVPVIVVLAVVVTLVAVKLAKGNDAKSGQASGLVSATLLNQVQNVPATVSTAIGAGKIQTPPTKLTGAALTASGKPRILFIGADYCPYCAAERWALTIALSRFGTFSKLGTTTSSPSDVYPSTQTFSYHGAKYTSSALVFNAYEMYTNQSDGQGYYTKLDTVPSNDMKIAESQSNKGQVSFPYINLGGKYLISGASYDPQVLHGLTRDEIAQDLSDASSAVAKAVVGTANVITAAICASTDNAPSSVCTAPGVVAAAKKLS